MRPFGSSRDRRTEDPHGIAVDHANDVIFVANFGSVSAYSAELLDSD